MIPLPIPRYGRRRVFRLLVAAACGLITLFGRVAQHAGVPADCHAASAAVSPRQCAVIDAAHIVASFPPPLWAVQTVVSWLKAPPYYPNTPDLVTATRWWVAPGRPQAVLAWVAAHLPAGFSNGGTGSTGDGTVSIWFDEFDLPVVASLLDSRAMLVQVAGDGAGRTAIRVDAQVVWLPAKPAAERIPADARVVTVRPEVSVPPLADGKPADPPVTITSPVRVAAIAAAVDNLPVWPPGVYVCPAFSGTEIRLTFRTSLHGPAVAELDGDVGCNGVSVTIDGRSMLPLDDSSDLLTAKTLAGARWADNPGEPEIVLPRKPVRGRGGAS
jgi:hypothetical protein